MIKLYNNDLYFHVLEIMFSSSTRVQCICPRVQCIWHCKNLSHILFLFSWQLFIGTNYCITGKFRDMKISQIWTVGNFATGKFREFWDWKYSRAGKFRESHGFREIREIFLHANISCYTVLLNSLLDYTTCIGKSYEPGPIASIIWRHDASAIRSSTFWTLCLPGEGPLNFFPQFSLVLPQIINGCPLHCKKTSCCTK